MQNTKYKQVYIPIVVPTGKYCWSFESGAICSHFDNTWGNGECTLGFDDVNLEFRDGEGYIKAPKCNALPEADSGDKQ